MEAPPPADSSASPHILLISRNELTDVTHRALHAAGARVTYLRDPTDRDIRRALREEVDAVVVISEDDHVCLRLALVVEGVRPGIRLIVTVYDRDVAAQLKRVMSMPDIVAPTLAGPCFDDRLLAVSRTPEGFAGVAAGDDGPRLVPIEPYSRSPGQRLLVALGSLLHPFEPSARTLMAGLVGFLLLLLLDTVATMIVLHESLVEGFYAATKTLVTVGPNPVVDEGPGWFKVFSAMVMLAAVAFTAIFTAGVVNRLLAPRLVAMAGRRAFPRRDHVVVVGLGQVGLRLCLLLRELGVAVVAIECDPEGDFVARAKQYGVPVVIGQGGSRFLLRRLSLERARAGGRYIQRDREHRDRRGCPRRARRSSHASARRAGRRGQRDALTVQHRGCARRAPGRRDDAGGRGARRGGKRGVPARADRVSGRARRPNRALRGRCEHCAGDRGDRGRGARRRDPARRGIIASPAERSTQEATE